MAFCWLYWLVVLPFSYSARITPQENMQLINTCGDSFLRPTFKTFGGQAFRQDEYPWIASLKIGTFMCSGVLISPRHILTAAHCLIDTGGPFLRKELCQQIGHRNSRRPLANEFEVFVGSRCPNPYRCTIPWVKAGHVYYHDAFDECSLENDIAIVELAGNVLNTFAAPICLPDRNQPTARVLKVAGSGWRGMPDAGRPELWPVGQQVVTVTFVQLDNNFIRVKPLPGMGICPGDSGGPLFQFNGMNQNTVIGLTSYVTSCFQHAPLKMETEQHHQQEQPDTFTDVRRHLDWICQITGQPKIWQCPTLRFCEYTVDLGVCPRQ